MGAFGKLFPKQALLALVVIPLSGGDNWHAMQYASEPPNEVSFSESELRLSVKGSASPLFYHFDHTQVLDSVFASGTVSGLPQIPAGKVEGEKGADDFALRLGVVLEGKRKLNWLEKFFAPSWLKQLTETLPDRPFGSVHFLTLSQTHPVGSIRKHPSSDLLVEETVQQLEKPGAFSLKKDFTPAERAIGLWIQADGDDTHSSFDVKIQRLEMTTSSR